MHSNPDTVFMAQALAQARAAAAAGEVPVGAVVVRDGQVIATAATPRSTPTTRRRMPKWWPAFGGAGPGQLPAGRLRRCMSRWSPAPCAAVRCCMRAWRASCSVRPTPKPAPPAPCSTCFRVPAEPPDAVARRGAGRRMQRLAQSLFPAAPAGDPHDRQPPARRRAAHTRCRFAGLPGYPWPPHYLSDLPVLAGLRLHYLDEGRATRR
jgi:tRNA(adenine34) deaminase